MIRRALLLAAGAALLVTLAYQRAATATVRLGVAGDGAITEGFGTAGMSQGRPWRWTTTQSSLRLRAAGQIAPGSAAIRVEVGVPRWAEGRPRRATLALDGAPLGVVSVVSGFAVHEFAVPRDHDAAGDWVLSLATEGVAREEGNERGVALARVEIVPGAFPSPPALLTLLNVVLAVVVVAALLVPRLGARVASAAGATAAAGAALALAFTRPQAVEASSVAGWALVVLLAVDWARSPEVRSRARRWLVGRTWVDMLAPVVALTGLVLASVGLFPASAVAVSIGVSLLWLARGVAVGVPGERDTPMRREGLVVAALTLLALGFRLYDLEGVPFSIFRDEARHGLLALRLLAEPAYRPLFVGPPINQPLPYFLAMAAAIRAFGVNLFALRVVSAVAGAVAVPLLFGLVREVLGQRVAVVAALLLAASSWHVSISRFAVNYVEPSLFSLPAYLLLWRALPRARTAGIALAALLVGLAQYTAHTAKPLLVVAAGLVVDETMTRLRARDGAGLRKLAVSLAVAALVGLAAVGPILLFIRENPGAYLARAQQVTLWNEARTDGSSFGALLLDNLRTYAAAFHLSGDPNGRHHLPGAPLLDPAAGLGLLVGAGLALTRLRSREARFLVLWLLAGLIPGVLTVDAPSALRTVEAAPAVYAMAAWGLVALWRRLPILAPRAGRVAGSVVLAAAVSWNAWVYFVRMYDSPTVWRRFAPIATHLGKRLQALRMAGALPAHLTLVMPRAFLDEPDTRYVLELYWPEGLEMSAWEDVGSPIARDAALVVPNERDYWSLVAREEARYSKNASLAEAAQERWADAAPSDRAALVGPPFPATERPMFRLYLPVP